VTKLDENKGIRERSVAKNLPKLSLLRRRDGGFGLSTIQNQLRPKQFVTVTRNSSRVAGLCAAKRTGRPGPSAETVSSGRFRIVLN
jgi:hypothetical protein